MVPDDWDRKWTIHSSMDWRAPLAWPAVPPSRGFWAFRSASVWARLPSMTAMPGSAAERARAKAKAKAMGRATRAIRLLPANPTVRTEAVVTMVAVEVAAPVRQASAVRHPGAGARASRMDVSLSAAARRAAAMAAAVCVERVAADRSAITDPAFAPGTAVGEIAEVTVVVAAVELAPLGKPATVARVAAPHPAAAPAVARARFASETSAGQKARKWRFWR